MGVGVAVGVGVGDGDADCASRQGRSARNITTCAARMLTVGVPDGDLDARAWGVRCTWGRVSGVGGKKQVREPVRV